METIYNIELCDLNELEENTALGFAADVTKTDVDIFIVKKNNFVYGYINSCPHTGAPLEWMPNQFLSLDTKSIQCSLHGARFSISEGKCLYGPCNGQSLTTIRLLIKDNKIYWEKKASENSEPLTETT